MPQVRVPYTAVQHQIQDPRLTNSEFECLPNISFKTRSLQIRSSNGFPLSRLDTRDPVTAPCIKAGTRGRESGPGMPGWCHRPVPGTGDVLMGARGRQALSDPLRHGDLLQQQQRQQARWQTPQKLFERGKAAGEAAGPQRRTGRP
jgi:hypothetical protein